jgi:hypothetical protein
MSAFPTWAVGEVVTAAKLTIYTTNLKGVCQVTRATQSITNSTDTTIDWVNESATVIDPLDWYVAATSTTVITPTIAGWYRVTLTWDWVADAGNDYTATSAWVEKNAATTVARYRSVENGAVVTTPSASLTTGLVQLNGTSDTIRMRVRQTNTSAGANQINPTMLVELVHPT